MAEMMKAGVLVAPKTIEMREVPVPQMEPGMIEIKVSACGVCGSDIHMWKSGSGWGAKAGKELIMGHEFCGVVTDTGDSRFQIGDRVVFWANLYCGKCDMCMSGHEQLCRDVNGTNYIGFVCDGGYAEKFVGKASNAYKLPDAVSDVAAGLIDPLMVAYHAVKHSGIKLHDKVLVAGSGIIGHMIGNSIPDTVAFEMNKAVLREITLKGSVSCTRQEFEETIDLIAAGMIDPEQYVTDILPLEELQQTFKRLTDENDPILKAVIKP